MKKLLICCICLVSLLFLCVSITRLAGCAKIYDSPRLSSFTDQVVANPNFKKQIPTSDIQKVYFIPGYLTQFSSQDRQLEILQKVYPNAKIEAKTWFSFNTWSIARTSADEFASQLAEELLQQPQTELNSTVLVGHSLGGRIVARIVAALGNKRQINHAVLLGAAIDSNDSLFDYIGAYDGNNAPIGGTLFPVFCICHNQDAILNVVYRQVEDAEALGLRGPEQRPSFGVLTKIIDFSQDIKLSSCDVYNDTSTNRQLFSNITHDIEKALNNRANRLNGAVPTPVVYNLATPQLKLLTDAMGLELSESDFAPSFDSSRDATHENGDKIPVAKLFPSYADIQIVAITAFYEKDSHASLEYLKGFAAAIHENLWLQ